MKKNKTIKSAKRTIFTTLGIIVGIVLLIIFMSSTVLSILHWLLTPFRTNYDVDYTIYYYINETAETPQNKVFWRTGYAFHNRWMQSNWFCAPVVTDAESFLQFVITGGTGFGFVPRDLVDAGKQTEIENGIKNIYNIYLETGELSPYHYYTDWEYSQRYDDLNTYLFYKNFDLIVDFKEWQPYGDSLLTVTYLANGGTFDNGLTREYLTYYDIGGIIEPILLSYAGITEPKRFNYIFVGWDTPENTEITTSTIVKAIWQIIETDMFVKFYVDNVIWCHMELSASSFDYWREKYGVFTPTYISLPIKNGFTFVKWNTEFDGSGIDYFNQERFDNIGNNWQHIDISINAGVYELYAIWQEN